MNIRGRLERIEDKACLSEPLRVLILKTNIDVSDAGPFDFDCKASEDIEGLCPAYRKAERNDWRGYGRPVIFCPPCEKCEGMQA